MKSMNSYSFLDLCTNWLFLDIPTFVTDALELTTNLRVCPDICSKLNIQFDFTLKPTRSLLKHENSLNIYNKLQKSDSILKNNQKQSDLTRKNYDSDFINFGMFVNIVKSNLYNEIEKECAAKKYLEFCLETTSVNYLLVKLYILCFFGDYNILSHGFNIILIEIFEKFSCGDNLTFLSAELFLLIITKTSWDKINLDEYTASHVIIFCFIDFKTYR